MTALTRYQKLESAGLWRATPNAKLREVIVNLGDTSVILTDPKQDQALAHWSLPAMNRLNPGGLPALFSPDPDGTETLELEDAEMIGALDKVHDVLEAARPHPGRLRNSILTLVALGVVGVVVFWVPDALVTHTASVLPEATRSAIGRAALADLARITGQPCHAQRGQEALALLSERIFGKGSARPMVVVREGIRDALHLPGREIVLSESLLAEQDSPDVAAGYALVEGIAADQADPMIPLLHYAGLRATFGLLTTGEMPAGSVKGYAETLIDTPSATPPDALILARFEAAGVSVTPYAQARYPGSDRAQPLVDGDPFADAAPPPLLPDEDWVGLQDICSQ